MVAVIGVGGASREAREVEVEVVEVGLGLAVTGASAMVGGGMGAWIGSGGKMTGAAKLTDRRRVVPLVARGERL